MIVDGSTDGTAEELQRVAAQDPTLRVIVLPRNRGKGAAVLHGLDLAAQEGFTHVLTMDSDGQHPAELIPAFMAASAAPGAMILGRPVFDASAPSDARQGPEDFELVGEPRDPLGGRRGFAIRFSRLSDRRRCAA